MTDKQSVAHSTTAAVNTRLAAWLIGGIVLSAGGIITGVLMGDSCRTGSGTTPAQIVEPEPKADDSGDYRRRSLRPPRDHRSSRLRDHRIGREGLQSPQDAPKPRERIEIGEVETKTTETNEAYHRISYIVSVRNNTARTIEEASLYLDFIDAAGFVLMSHLDFVRLKPGENKLRGIVLLDTPWALQTPSVEARVEAD